MPDASDLDMPVVGKRVPSGMDNKRDLGLYGMAMLVFTEAALFAYLLFSFYFTWSQRTDFGPSESPSLTLAGSNTLVLLASSGTLWLADGAVKHDRRRAAQIAVLVTIFLGVCFLAVQSVEWRNKDFTLASSLYGSLYFVITGFHMAHVLAGLIMLSAICVWLSRGYISSRRHAALSSVSAYWHFVDVVWILVFVTFYIAPRLV